MVVRLYYSKWGQASLTAQSLYLYERLPQVRGPNKIAGVHLKGGFNGARETKTCVIIGAGLALQMYELIRMVT